METFGTLPDRVRAPEHKTALIRNLIPQGSRVTDNTTPRLGVINANHEDALMGDNDPKYLLARERPWHRQVINMSAAGYTNIEIARFMKRDIGAVENTLRQPWAREYLIKEAKKTVQDEIKQLLESQALPSIRKLVAIRDSVSLEEGSIPASPADKNVAAQAANSLLDRFLGKPTQPITNDAKPMAEMSDAELRAQVVAELSTTKEN